LPDDGPLRTPGPLSLLSTALDPPMPARADAVVVIAAHLAAVPIEVDADRSTPTALRARPPMAIRREVGRLDGRGGHQRGRRLHEA
jgi:hypothetical protein